LTLSTAPQARLTPGILPSALRARLSAVPNRSRRFGQHRRGHVRPLWRHPTDRGQHRRTSPTSQSTARWSKRATAPLRAHRLLVPRDTPSAVTPKAKHGETTRSGN
jgi:hypothetical protein